MISLTCNESIATISLNNPEKHNALTSGDITQFIEYLDEVEESDNCVLLISAAEGKTFCAGASLNELGGNLSGEIFATLTERLAAISIPTICALGGNAYGGGAEIALSCDFRIGYPTMRVFVPAARFGLCYPLSGIQRYVQKLGIDAAKRMLVASEEFDGNSLKELGFLTHLVERNQVHATALALAKQLSQLAPVAVRTMNILCEQIASNTVNTDTAQQLIAQCNNTEDLQEGLSAAREKRNPVFNGR